MYCRNCSTELADNSKLCSVCTLHPLLESNYCNKCARPTTPIEVMCIKCGEDLTKGSKLSFKIDLYPAYKKLYRSSDEKIILGVLAGLSHRFKLPKQLFRFLLVLSLFFMGYYGIMVILIYLSAAPLMRPNPTKNV